MRVQKFAPRFIEKISRNWPNGYCRNLLYRIRDNYILSDDETITIKEDFIDGNERIRPKRKAVVVIQDKNEGFELTCSIEKPTRKGSPSVKTTVFKVEGNNLFLTVTETKVSVL